MSNESVLFESSFDQLERVSVLETRRTPIERFVDRALWFASTWHARPGSRDQDLAGEIREEIAPHADGEGRVLEVLEGHALVARRSRDVTLLGPISRERWGSLVPFEDLDGNVLKLFQSPA